MRKKKEKEKMLSHCLSNVVGGGSAKRTTWEGGHRVPTVAYWPGRIPQNITSSALLRYFQAANIMMNSSTYAFLQLEIKTHTVSSFSGMDIFSTVLSLAGVTPPTDRHYDGIDATHILLNSGQTGHEVVMTNNITPNA